MMPKLKKKYTGWSHKGKPFTSKQFASSHVKKLFGSDYGSYLQEYGTQYKIKVKDLKKLYYGNKKEVSLLT